METNKKQRGRPPVDISWPDVVFTAQDVVDSCTKKVSRVTIHSKLNSAVDSGELKVVGQVKSSNGRPRVKYLKASLDERGEQQADSCPAPRCPTPSQLQEEPEKESEKEW